MPNPSDFKTEEDFVSACIAARQDEHPDEEQEQSAAACYSIWREKSAKGGIIHKTHSAEVVDMEFVLSDETIDRYGDVINSDGWVLDDFNKNPICLFNHNPDFPIGSWHPPRVANRGLRSKLKLAPEGTSPRIDEIRKLIDAGILRAVSVGFAPITSEPLSKSGAPGNRYVKSALVECSVVSVPANPNSLAVAKSLKVSDDTLKMVFAEQGVDKTKLKVRGHGEQAETSATHRKNSTMANSPLAQRVIDAEQRIVKLKDQLTEHLTKLDDTAPDEASTLATETLTKDIETSEKALSALKNAEKKLAAQAQAVEEKNGGDSTVVIKNDRPFAVPAKKVLPRDYIWRSLTVACKHHAERGRKTMIDILKETYGEDKATFEVMNVLTRAAVSPATTTGSKWADTLVQTVIGDFIESLMPVSVYPQLSTRGASFTFGRNGTVSMPAREATPTVAGGFVLQGDPIPVKAASFAPVTLTPHKMAVITTMTREITEHSTPAIEGILRQAILADTAVALDTALLDDTVGSTTRPAGLRYGVAKVSATGAGGIAALIGDIKGLTGALITATSGNLRTPVWVMNPGQVLTASLLQGATGSGDMPFRDELARGTLNGIPVIQSTTGTTDMMYLVDAADFLTATGDAPRFDVSDQAVLHMENTSPTQIGVVGTPNTFAAPARSLWQTDSMAIRMILDVSWGKLRTGTVQWTEAMTWMD